MHPAGRVVRGVAARVAGVDAPSLNRMACVTGTYLAQLARARDGRLMTFDRGVAGVHADVACLVPRMAQ